MASEIIEQLIASNPDSPPETIARIVYEKHRVLAIDIIAREIIHVRRIIDRASEETDVDELLDAMQPTKPLFRASERLKAGDVTAEFMSILTAKFALGNGERVTWGEATVEQHETRLRLIMANIKGLSETADRHRKAISLLRQTGAKCIGDLAAKGAVA